MDDRNRHAADSRGFGSITLPPRVGLPCRYGCGAIFRRDGDQRDVAALQLAARDRDSHEHFQHGGTFASAVTTLGRRRRFNNR